VQVTDTGAIDAAIDAVIAANPDKVEEVKAKPKLAGMVRRSGDETDRGKSESGRRKRRSQDPTQSARRGVIRTKCAKSFFARPKCRIFICIRNDKSNHLKSVVLRISGNLRLWESPGTVAFLNASLSY
jgi:hypothetical protein